MKIGTLFMRDLVDHKPDGYKYDLPKETKLDESTLKAFSEEAHKLGLLPKQAQGIINYYNKLLNNQSNLLKQMRELRAKLKLN